MRWKTEGSMTSEAAHETALQLQHAAQLGQQAASLPCAATCGNPASGFSAAALQRDAQPPALCILHVCAKGRTQLAEPGVQPCCIATLGQVHFREVGWPRAGALRANGKIRAGCLGVRAVGGSLPQQGAWQPCSKSAAYTRPAPSQHASAPARCARCVSAPAPARRAALRRCGSRTGMTGRSDSPRPAGSRPQTRLQVAIS